MNTLKEKIKLADIHATRMTMAMDELKPIFPLCETKIANLNKQQFLLLELLTSRFTKLQDLIGRKIIDEFLLSKEEFIDTDTMIDKINKLERMQIISNAQTWSHMREVRNHIAHEYPDRPELTARYLNQLFDLSPKLLAILHNIKNKI
jgi:hypothetical protein